MSKILVLAGGSVKGAFQAGVMKAMMERGYQPDAVYGVSAGSLNAAYFVNQLGMQAITGEPISFKDASQDLWDFWESRITSPESLSKPFNIFQLGLSALRKKFKGLVDTMPLRNLLTEVYAMWHPLKKLLTMVQATLYALVATWKPLKGDILIQEICWH